MERRARFRTGVFIALILAVMCLFTFRLYKIQTSQDEEARQKANSSTYYTIIDAARGQLLDRNGTVLVTNRASYNLVIINFVLFNGPTPNESLLELLELCDQLELDVVSHLPITAERPYEYTLDRYDSNWQSYFRKFLQNRGWDPDMAASTLMKNLRDEYNIPEELTEEEAYRLISVRYELELRFLDVPLENYVLAKDVSSEALAAVMELGVPGVIVETTTVRDYKTTYAAHLLGHTGLMNADEYQNIYKEQDYAMDAVVGKEGVELAFERYLHGEDGLKSTTVSSTGEVLNETYLSVPQPGSNVELTIDINLQAAGEEALKKKILDLQENGIGRNKEGKDASRGAVVAMEVKTGDVLVSASYPSYDPARYNLDFNELAADEDNPLYNRALLAEYPPGSIYKMVTAIAAVDYANVGRYFEVTDLGKYTKYEAEDYTPACYIYTSSGITHGTVNMMEALQESCNYYFYEVGLKVATTDVDYVAKKLGLGEHTGIEVLEEIGTRANQENKALVYAGTDQEAWVDGDKLQASIGQGLNYFTPLQMACYTAALANKGLRYEATLLQRVVSWDFKELLEENTPAIADVLEMSDEALTAYQEGMVLAASKGTAATFFSDYPVAVAAKTGTAQHGSGGSDHASFICYAPADDPEIAVVVYVENGSQGGNLGEVARAIFDAYFSQESKYEITHEENIVQ